MSQTSTIQWTDATWNPVRGCSRVSAGCDNCYAMHQAHRQNRAGGAYEGLTRVKARGVDWAGKAVLVPELLDAPLTWRKPRRVFVNSMSDLFHESLKEEDIDRVFAVMARSPQHTFQVLTKRPKRMLSYLTREIAAEVVATWVYDPGGEAEFHCEDVPSLDAWPLPNVWLGVSVEDQASADERIPILLQTPAAVRFVSYEPALGPVRLRAPEVGEWPERTPTKALANPAEWDDWKYWAARDRGIKWVIVGGESGPRARPCDVAWVRSIVEQCKASGVPVFVKQLGAVPVGGPNVEREWDLRDRKGGDPSEWPEDLRVREFPI